MAWHDPHGLWPAAGGRRGVVCLLPSCDAELGLAAALDRPGAPAHYFVHCPHHEQSRAYRTLLALQRVGHRLDVDCAGTRGMAWRQLRRGARVFTLLTMNDVASSDAVPAPLRLARLAGVPVLLLGHRCNGAGAGTLHVVGEYAGAALDAGSPRLLESASRFLRASPHDCHAADACKPPAILRSGPACETPVMRILYPAIEPYREFTLAVSDLHTLHIEECGTPAGIPVVYLHGGPGAGISPTHRRFFDPARYRIVLIDQRGSGRSTPFGELRDNTTQALVADIEKVREHLGIERWLVYGGSWGSTLSLAYAQAHPARATGLIRPAAVRAGSSPNAGTATRPIFQKASAPT
ncbi:hypothetical protein G6F31_014688 [Rhizopus arrhizus]|nr:hypothetical protein G6F31_014688 [Rhizopus arrhizus]